MSWKTLEKSGLEPAAPNRLADRKHCALSTQPNPHLQKWMVHWWILGAGFSIDTGDHGGCWHGHSKENTDRTVSTFHVIRTSWVLNPDKTWPDRWFSKMHERRGLAWVRQYSTLKGFSRHGASRPLSWNFLAMYCAVVPRSTPSFDVICSEVMPF